MTTTTTTTATTAKTAKTKPMKTKGGKMSWGSKQRIALTVLFNTYLEDSTEGVSYETSDTQN